MAATSETLGRITGLVLGLDYGDEQERLRYYETYAVAVHLQLIGLPAVGAVVIAVAGRSATVPVLIMLATAFVAILVGLSHLRRHSVRAEAIAMSKRNRGYMIAYAISCLALVSAIASRGSRSGFDGGLAIGAASGLAIGFAALGALAWRQRSAEDAPSTDA
jgi:hypothetical protein